MYIRLRVSPVFFPIPHARAKTQQLRPHIFSEATLSDSGICCSEIGGGSLQGHIERQTRIPMDDMVFFL